MLRIMLPNGEQTKLARDFGVSRKSVWEALTGRKDTDLAKMLRRAAIERGGMEYDPERVKKCSKSAL